MEGGETEFLYVGDQGTEEVGGCGQGGWIKKV